MSKRNLFHIEDELVDAVDYSPSPKKKPRKETKESDSVGTTSDSGQDSKVEEVSRKLRKVFLSKDERARNRKQGFCMISALCPYVDILLNVVRHLPPRTIINLYSISAPFHYQFDSRYQTFILEAIKLWAPKADVISPWRCYSPLCIKDPGLRLPSTYRPDPARPYDPSLPENIQWIPSLRWLSMVVYRHLIVREILSHLLASQLPCPAITANALSKTWFMLDMPMTAPRVSLIQNTEYFTNADLWTLQHFFVKLDMYFTDPVAYSGGERSARKYLLQEKTLSTLWDFMRGVDGQAYIDWMRLWVKHGYTPAPRPADRTRETEEEREAWEHADEFEVMGVPLRLCGRGGHELYGLGVRKLLRPDELVVRESVRRGLNMETKIWQMFKWGSMDAHLKPVRKFRFEEAAPSARFKAFMDSRRRREEAWDEEGERARRKAEERRVREAREAQVMEVD